MGWFCRTENEVYVVESIQTISTMKGGNIPMCFFSQTHSMPEELQIKFMSYLWSQKWLIIRFSAINVPLNLLWQLWSEEQLCPAGLLQPDLFLFQHTVWLLMLDGNGAGAGGLSNHWALLCFFQRLRCRWYQYVQHILWWFILCVQRQKRLRVLLFMCVKNNSSWQNGFYVSRCVMDQKFPLGIDLIKL